MNNDDFDTISFSELNGSTKTNIFLLDTTTLLSMLVIVVFMIKLSNKVLKSKVISSSAGKRSFTTKFFGNSKMCWNCDQQIDRSRNGLKLRKRMHMMMPSPSSRQSGGVR